jgi:class 3 adenylate cyclase/pimeloyl-ACP methyl ester carboxylesterase
MEPRIQYTKTSDGVNIAYWVMGSGPPIVWMPTIPATHIEREWELPLTREAYDAIARSNTLVRYDGRGFGLSDRDVSDFSVRAMVRDLEAIANHLGLESFDILAFGFEGSCGIAYTARNPERVSHLVLWHVPASGNDVSEQYHDLAALAQRDWEMASEAWIRATIAWEEGDLPRVGAGLMRASADPAHLRAYMEQLRDRDVRDLLPNVAVPTLVMHRREYRLPPLDASRRIAAAIPGAELRLLEGSSYYFGPDGLAASLAFFMGHDVLEKRGGTRDMRVILFTDVEGSTALTQRLGDAKAREIFREHERIVREALKAHGGSEVKTMGDGFMASFGSVTKAVECAIGLQKAFADREGEPLSVRVGLNAGEPIQEEGDLFGATVILASRIAAKAEGGEILVSDNVRSLCSGKGFLFADRGEFVAKGFEAPVQVYEVRRREE